jgi:hypothetical protein
MYIMLKLGFIHRMTKYRSLLWRIKKAFLDDSKKALILALL